MKNISIVSYAIITCCFFSFSDTLQGIVTDAENSNPIENVKVSLENQPTINTLTAADGRFSINTIVSIIPNSFSTTPGIRWNQESQTLYWDGYNADVSIQIRTIQGRLQLTFSSYPNTQTRFRMPQFAPGIYFIAITTKGHTTINKYVKLHSRAGSFLRNSQMVDRNKLAGHTHSARSYETHTLIFEKQGYKTKTVSVEGTNTNMAVQLDQQATKVLTSLTGSYTDNAVLYLLPSNMTVNTAVTFGNNTRYQIDSVMTINSGGSLILEAGVSIQFSDSGRIVVGDTSNGILTIQGTPASRVIMAPKTGSKIWQGLMFDSTATGSAINGLDLSGAAYGITVKDAIVTVTNSRITGCSTVGVAYKGSARPDSLDGSGFANNVIMDCDSFGMSVNANAVGYLAINDSLLDTIEITDGLDIDANQTWRPQPLPYVVTREISITDSMTLTLKAGTGMRFSFYTGIGIGSGRGGILLVEGTADQPVTMGPRDPAIGWQASGSSQDIGSLIFYFKASGSKLNFLHLDKSTSNGIWVRSAIVDVTNCRITNCGSSGIFYAAESRPSAIDGSGFTNNVIRGCPKGLAINPNAVGYMGVNDSLGDTIYVGLEDVGGEGKQPEGIQVWNRLPVPYVIMQNIEVANGATLTMAAGTQYLFSAYTGIAVGAMGEGTLNIAGSETEPVIMRPYKKVQGWKHPYNEQEGGLVFDTGSSASSVAYLTLSGASKNGICLFNTQLAIENLTLDSCASGAGIKLDSDADPSTTSLALTNAAISTCQYGISVLNGSVLDTTEVTFSGNEEDIHTEP